MIVDDIEDHYKKNYNKLLKRVRYKASTVENAEDIIQEAYYRTLKYQDTFVIGMDFNLWFSRILSNVIKDFIREKFNYGVHIEFDEEHDDLIPMRNDVVAIFKGLSDEIELIEDESHKEVVKLHQLLGFPIRDIVNITDLKYKHIDTILFRFKKRMEDKYAEG